MDTTSGQRKPRSTQSQQTGNRGHSQASERFEDFGWSAKTIYPDSGEDLLVEVQDNYCATGLHFFVQLKSSLAMKLKKGRFIHEVKTKDLKHWADKKAPVFLVLWDVQKRQGHWHCIDDVLSELSKRKPDWASKTGVRVRIPQGNGTDNSGLLRLRKRAADKMFPLVAAEERQLHGNISFQFPDTPEGRADIEGLKRHRATGEPVTLSARHVNELSFSDWFIRLYGPEATRVINSDAQLMLGPAHSEEIIDLRLCALSPQERLRSQQKVQVKAISVGDEQITYSNQGMKSPFVFTFVARKSGHFSCHFSLRGTVCSATALHAAMPFLVALSEGGFFRMETTSHAEKWKGWAEIKMACRPQKNLAPDPLYQKIVAQLAEIEEKTTATFHLDDEGISQEEAQKIENVVNLLRQGVREQDAEGITWTLSGFESSGVAESPRQMVGSLVANHHEKEVAEFSANGSLCAQILGIEVPLGPQQMTFTGRLTEECFAQLERMLANGAPLDPLQLTWQKGRLRELCFDWLPDFYELNSEKDTTHAISEQRGYQEIRTGQNIQKQTKAQASEFDPVRRFAPSMRMAGHRNGR